MVSSSILTPVPICPFLLFRSKSLHCFVCAAPRMTTDAIWGIVLLSILAISLLSTCVCIGRYSGEKETELVEKSKNNSNIRRGSDVVIWMGDGGALSSTATTTAVAGSASGGHHHHHNGAGCGGGGAVVSSASGGHHGGHHHHGAGCSGGGGCGGGGGGCGGGGCGGGS
ncbi:hypothetical protein RHGRI_018211 [Rhododendron griersonianum]|uniref:Glycine-rich protein n=1 Tax=Rhododendron griersonianum TaxID=479676 RepID=A0AAV6K0N7_9ERIC|nr:hypothetical protein RHGRI_018211 [Rhododendron griersonianum]